MSNWRDDLPDWGDNLKNIEAVLDDGTSVRSKLDLYEMTPGPEEHPMFRICVDGRYVNMVDVLRWKFID